MKILIIDFDIKSFEEIWIASFKLKKKKKARYHLVTYLIIKYIFFYFDLNICIVCIMYRYQKLQV